jgi:hypothetical protein
MRDEFGSQETRMGGETNLEARKPGWEERRIWKPGSEDGMRDGFGSQEPGWDERRIWKRRNQDGMGEARCGIFFVRSFPGFLLSKFISTPRCPGSCVEFRF